MSPPDDTRWQPGDQVVIREVIGGEVWSAKPVTVVDDSESLLVLFIHEGVEWKSPTGANGNRPRPRDRVTVDGFELQPAKWMGPSTLYITQPGAEYVVLMKVAAQDPHWYVNLQDPFRRTGIGFDYLDQFLDLVSSGPGQWEWKDEDELDEAIELGMLTPEQVGSLYQEGQRVRAMIAGNVFPFDRDWTSWLPDPKWSMPALPETWARVRTD